MKVKCYSVKVALMEERERCFKVKTYDGSTAYIPKGFVYGQDFQKVKSDAWWISAWWLENKTELQYSAKKTAWFDKDTGRELPSYVVTRHVAEKRQAVENNDIEELRR